MGLGNLPLCKIYAVIFIFAPKFTCFILWFIQTCIEVYVNRSEEQTL